MRTKRDYGNPLPELIAFASWEVLGRFSAGRQLDRKS